MTTSTACLVPAIADSFLRGQTLRAEMVFEDPEPADPDDPYVDPDEVTVRVLHPGESPEVDVYVYGEDVEVVREAAGQYYLLITPDTAGMWAVRWEGVGTWPAVAEKQFRVRTGLFAP
jgi:hypothetical protein